MNQTFTFKTVLLALLVMICCAAKAETVQYQTDDGFTYEINMETQEAALSKYNRNATNVVIPEKIAYEGKEYKVTSLGVYCFVGCSSLASITIPSSVTSLGYQCFSGCSSLVSIDIPSSVTSLGNECFYGCSSLVSVDIPSSVTSLGERCFSYCSSLETIVVDANNPCYDSREGCNAIIVTASNTMIAGCKNTFIPSSVTGLGHYCFHGCSSLASVVIPSSVTWLGEGCFYGCRSLASIEIPSSVTILVGLCFSDCSSLTSIAIPSSVTSLGNNCFSGCSSLETIVVDANNSHYDSREGCNAIIETASNTMIAGCKSTFIPSSVTSLSESCFSGCSSLASIDIPSSVASLGRSCFYGCLSLASIAIPSSVTSLGDYCFDGCNSLKTVICRMESVKSGNFFGYGYGYGTPIENATLYVPESLLATYQATDPWSRFGTILPLTEEVELGISDTSKPVFSLRSDDGSVVLSGLADGTPVSYYSIDGRLLGRTSLNNGSASFSVKPNSIVTVKAGKQSFKVCVK